MMRMIRRAGKMLLCFFILFAAGALAVHLGYGTFIKSVYPLHFEEIVMQEARKNDLDPALVYAVMKAESNFDENAHSHAGAMGLMQITPDTFAWLQTKTREGIEYTVEDLYRPEVNIRYGCFFLNLLLQKYDRLETALCAYNAGIGTVNSWLQDAEISQDGSSLSRIPYRETRRYTEAVLRNYERYSEIYEFGIGVDTNG